MAVTSVIKSMVESPELDELLIISVMDVLFLPFMIFI